METKKARRYFILVIAIIVLIITSVILIVCLYKPTVEVPWWKDYENLEYVIEDERSEEKSFTYRRPFNQEIEFNYTFDSANTEEYIPKVRILHKGVEKEVYTWVYTREWFFFTGDGYDYDDPHVETTIKWPGAYRVSLYVYSNKENADKQRYEIEWAYIYINVQKGEEK